MASDCRHKQPGIHEEYVKNECVVNRLLETISFEEDFETVISKMLCIVGENTGADHCRVCRYLDDQFNNWREVASWITPEAQSDKTRCIRADIASARRIFGRFGL